jgi:NAD(P)-dependent dehydrogenase (short-subunit alcohol dehydrogenase family)
MAGSMQGKTVFLTGAARGIGAGAAKSLAAQGANLALVGLEPELINAVAAECGPNAIAIDTDVTDVAALEKAVATAVERFGGIDVVIANAGIAPMGMVHSMDPAAFELTVEINLLGVWRTVRAALPEIMASKGYILVVASAAAALHTPLMSAYSASKAGVEAFADVLRAEMLPHGVDVGCAYYSWISTDMVKGADEHSVGGFVRKKLPWPMGKTYPVQDAIQAMVDGVNGRKSHVMAPGWLHQALALRWFLAKLPKSVVRPIVKQANDMLDAEIAAKGTEAVSKPMGDAGTAAMASKRSRT